MCYSSMAQATRPVGTRVNKRPIHPVRRCPHVLVKSRILAAPADPDLVIEDHCTVKPASSEWGVALLPYPIGPTGVRPNVAEISCCFSAIPANYPHLTFKHNGGMAYPWFPFGAHHGPTPDSSWRGLFFSPDQEFGSNLLRFQRIFGQTGGGNHAP